MLSTPLLNRQYFLNAMTTRRQWDILVIGGGATGLGIAVDSAARGYSTLLLEGADFAKGTSSRSTKLVHGGVRYLAQGNIRLVYEALRERGILQQNAPHLVKRQSFVIPCYRYGSLGLYWAGLKIYDWLSGKYSFGASRLLKKQELFHRFPGLKARHLTGGVEYFDGQFDDARLAINLAQTAAEKGAVLLNYCKVTGLRKENGRICGATAIDSETNQTYDLSAKVVINATGVFVDAILQMDQAKMAPLVRPSQGIHVVVDDSFLSRQSALMIPKTADGRVLFAVPWQQCLLVGTTDTPLDTLSLEPVAREEELRFILDTLGDYLVKSPGRSDVKTVFAGLRPLAATQQTTGATKEISRSHKIMVSPGGLVTITGGKWTTYRKMAEDAVDKAIEVGSLPLASCSTKKIPVHGAGATTDSVYGTDEALLQELARESPSLGATLLNGYPYTEAEVIWAVRHEMARRVEDVLARRLRLLFIDACAALKAAPRVAELMAAELGYDKEWQGKEVAEFTALAQNYFLPSPHYEEQRERTNLSGKLNQ